MLWRMSAEPHLDRIGVMLACLDNLPQRHRSVTLHAAAPDVDFRTSMWYERIPGRHDPCSRNSPSRACHAKPPAIGISLAEIAGITRSGQRPARAGPRDWHNACGNCGNPRHGPPAGHRDRNWGGAERAERSETHFSGPYSGTQVFLSSNGTCSERVDDGALVPRLEGELRAGADAGRPARGHGLELGVEAHAFHAVDAVVAEDRGLPAAEGVVGHRHRDRHVDADHADLDVVGEGTRGVAVAGEDRRAVAVGMVVHQPDRLVEAPGAHHRQHRSEDLVLVDRHVGLHVVEQAAAHEVAVLVALQLQPALKAASTGVPCHGDAGNGSMHPFLARMRTLGRNPGLFEQFFKESKKQTWKYWGLAVIVNLGAAVVAALAFGAWQRSQAPQSAANVPGKGGGGAFYELVDDVGYVPRANARMTRAEAEGRRTIDDVVYTIGPDHFRVVPKAIENADACVLLFGDSFTFGVGVSDEETYAAQIAMQSGGRVATQNFAVGGWGPHQFLAGLQSGRFQRAVRCRPADAVFLMVPSLIWRA